MTPIGDPNSGTQKTQPQKLLEEIIPKDLPRDENEKYPTDPDEPGPMWNAPKFPTIQEQQKYWDDKEKAAEPTPPRKWSAARRRRYNERKKAQEIGLPVGGPNIKWPEDEPVQMVRFCPCCGRNIERFLA